MRDERQEQITEAQKKKLAEMQEKQRPMTTVVLDGDERTCYFVGQRELDLDETVVAVPFHKLLILVGQLLTSVIAPVFMGARVMVTEGEVRDIPRNAKKGRLDS